MTLLGRQGIQLFLHLVGQLPLFGGQAGVLHRQVAQVLIRQQVHLPFQAAGVQVGKGKGLADAGAVGALDGVLAHQIQRPFPRLGVDGLQMHRHPVAQFQLVRPFVLHDLVIRPVEHPVLGDQVLQPGTAAEPRADQMPAVVVRQAVGVARFPLGGGVPGALGAGQAQLALGLDDASQIVQPVGKSVGGVG